LTINLPKASIFFMTYMVTTSLTSASGALLQVRRHLLSLVSPELMHPFFSQPDIPTDHLLPQALRPCIDSP
jgi:hypothetical protein